jgi:hypothetical protein
VIVFLLLLLFLIFSGIKAAPVGEFWEDYLSKEKTNAIKGIFVILVLFRHASQYMNLGGAYDEPFLLVEQHTGQMLVTIFFFYSGYGMMESIQKKGFDYVKKIAIKRFPKVYLNFFAAVVLYFILDLCLGELSAYDWKTVAWSFIGWKNIGNSNWYMFAIFIIYILTFLAFYLLRWNQSKTALFLGTVLLTFFTMGYVYWQMQIGQPGYFYNTVFIFPLGCWYSLCKPWIEKIMMKNELCYMLVCAITIVLYAAAYGIRGKYGIEGYTVWAVVFTLTIVWFTMKISVYNSVLEWFGKHIFSVYILQRIPMILLASMGIGYSHRYFFLVISIAITILLSQLFDTVVAYCTNIVWEKRENG